MQHDLILGTAGHIDHGKTSLIEALTGAKTDRLPEERKRGITIENGYAFLDLDPWKVGVIDVPGHEKFVRQMLAGATGMDIAMLVVAADDSVKPQTVEHLEILGMLNLKAGVIAITKSDLVTEDWLEMVEEEIRQHVAGTFLADAPVVPCSSKSGVGIDQLRDAIAKQCESVATRLQDRLNMPFRMAIDRSFSIAGHGTVVTGSVVSGALQTGDTIQLQPGDREVRVRGIENHDAGSDHVQRGQRAAINLAGVAHQDVRRGHELAANGYLRESTIMLVSIRLLPATKKPLEDRTRVRLHLGTTEILANVRLLESATLEPGQTGLAQVYLSESAVAVHGQPMVIRSESPVATIGGGTVLHPQCVLLKRPTAVDLRHAHAMFGDDAGSVGSSAIYLLEIPDGVDQAGFVEQALPCVAGVSNPQEVIQALTEEGTLQEIRLSQSRSLRLHTDRLREIADRVVMRLNAMHDAYPLRFNHLRSDLEKHFRYLSQQEVLAAAIEHLKQEKRVIANVQRIGLTDRGPRLSKGQKALLAKLIEDVQAAGLQGPTQAMLESATTRNRESVGELLAMAVENGDMVRIDPDGFHIHGRCMEESKGNLKEALENSDGMTVSDIRQVLGVSRKYSVPICEYLDAIGFTRRADDRRFLQTSANME